MKSGKAYIQDYLVFDEDTVAYFKKLLEEHKLRAFVVACGNDLDMYAISSFKPKKKRPKKKK